MKLNHRAAILWVTRASAFSGMHAQNYAWPEEYEGVMLQGFYWDSYNDTRWTRLTNQADELSKFFSLIWIPNSGYSGSGNNMGYTPQYWFSNHNSSFGSEEELRAMISKYKELGTGIIADVVINHRNGVSNWTDFPTETWHGQTWHIGTDGICSTDEVRNAAGQAKPTGAPDTGEDFDGARDLDHTNANVQNNCKNYCLFLLNELGYTGFRYDMTKGYSGEYTKIYNEYSKPAFSVGEYWDGSYDAVAAWIEATGKQSAAFDFPFKYAVNKAFSSGDLTELTWKAPGGNLQPAGLIHFGYPQYAVTFIDNHDTYRDSNAFTGNVAAANAFMLCSPGTPCVFLPHYKTYRKEIQQLVNVRNSVGLHNLSAVDVLTSNKNCYMARVQGKYGELVVRIGTSEESPSGYGDSDIVASGDSYCIWSKTEIKGEIIDTEDPLPADMPSKLYLIGNIEGSHWSTSSPIEMVLEGNTYYARNITLSAAAGETNAFFSFITAKGSDWNAVNGSDRYGAATTNAPISIGNPSDMVKYPVNINASAAASWAVAPGKYDISASFDNMKVGVYSAGSTGITDIIPDESIEAEYYNIQGIRVHNPSVRPGIYIVRKGRTVSKEIIK